MVVREAILSEFCGLTVPGSWDGEGTQRWQLGHVAKRKPSDDSLVSPDGGSARAHGVEMNRFIEFGGAGPAVFKVRLYLLPVGFCHR